MMPTTRVKSVMTGPIQPITSTILVRPRMVTSRTSAIKIARPMGIGRPHCWFMVVAAPEDMKK